MDGRAAATFILISVSLLSRSAADGSLKQSPQTLLVNTKGRSCRFYCDIGSQLSDGTLIHWYRQTEGKEVERILYQNSGEYINDEGFKQRFTGGRRDRRIILTVTGATPKDAGIYYCAYWEDTAHRRADLRAKTATQASATYLRHGIVPPICDTVEPIDSLDSKNLTSAQRRSGQEFELVRGFQQTHPKGAVY